MRQRLYSIMNRGHLTRVLTVFLNHGPARQVAHAYDMIRFVHASFLDGIYSRIDVTATAVEVRSMYMDHQWFAADLLGEDTGRIGQPVVTVDDIEIQTVRQHRCHGFVVADLLDQVIRIATRETYATQVVRTDTTIVVADTVTQTIELLGAHLALHPLFDVIIVHIFPDNRHAVSTDDAQERLVLITPGFRDDESDLQIFLFTHASGQTVTGGTQTA